MRSLISGFTNLLVWAVVALVVMVFATIYIVAAILAAMVTGTCWLLADVIFEGNRRFGLRILDSPFDLIERWVIEPATAIAIPVLAIPYVVYTEYNRKRAPTVT